MVLQCDVKIGLLLVPYKQNHGIFLDNFITDQVIIIKLKVHIYEVCVTKPVNIDVNLVNNYVTSFDNRSKIWAVKTPSIFELERRSKAQNIGTLLVISVVC